MSHDIETDEPKAKEGEGFLRRLLDRIDPSAGDVHSDRIGSPHSTSTISRDLFSADTRCPW